MALQVFGTNSIGLNTQTQLSTTDDALIAAGVTVASTSGLAVFGSGDGHSVDVQGTVAGPSGAIWLGNTPVDSGQHVVIGKNGYAASPSTQFAAVTVQSTDSRVDNAGTIHGEFAGLRIGGSGQVNQSIITNIGLIEATTYAISRYSGSEDTMTVHNSGELRGLAFAFSSIDQATDRIFNSGLIVGDVWLGAGDDHFNGTGGRLDGSLYGAAGADEIIGGAFEDNFNGDEGNDIMFGGEGDDFVYGGADTDQLDGGAGNDTVSGGSGNDIVSGGTGNDRLWGFGDVDQIDGGAGDDTIDGGSGNDTVSGGAGNDTIDGGAGGDIMSGVAGNDAFFVDSAGDVVSELGGSGVDTVSSLISFNLSDAVQAKGTLENLTLTGNAAINGTGNALANTITGNIAANILSGLVGNDVLNGGGGADRLLGGAGNDVLRGQDGLDRLHGGAGKDTLTGGTGADSFVFDTAPNTAANRDIVTDFVHGQDKFFLENAVFAKLGAAGALKAGTFHAGTAAHDADDRIVYNKATGILSYDADGNGTLPAVQFGVLTNKPVLTATDFAVI